MSEEILKELAEIKGNVRSLTESLYGRTPSDPGDIGEIKECLKNINGFKTRLIRLEVIVFVLVSGGITGITKGIGWW